MTALMDKLTNETYPSTIFEVVRERQQELFDKRLGFSRRFDEQSIAAMSQEDREDMALIRAFWESVTRSWHWMTDAEAEHSNEASEMIKSAAGDFKAERLGQLLAYKALGQLPDNIAIAA
ncbi:hypothetical protein Kim5_CH00792 [Rhizobium sp. Kim5]|uniref:hypothetical protein n=1 Tax=Rhizobium sp. Kim5 TaxID=2020311 RepID=UPI000A2A2BC2|nr:hypothetical protein [Rhizobium sp. Kim5]ARQ56900.1 hypothetical protein Kim5_CH00792 [Rhizobium sp. Kim5]